MGKRNIRVNRFSAATVLMAVLCATVVTPLAAQQAADVPAVTPLATQEATDAPAVTETTPAPASSESNVLPGPRLLPTHFQSVEPIEARAIVPEPSPVAAGQHTIVVSTLVLVLAIIVIVLLVD